MENRGWRNLTVVLFLLLPLLTYAQNKFKLEGMVRDAKDSTAIPGCPVILTDVPDTTKLRGVATDTAGLFVFDSLSAGTYKMKITFIGYAVYMDTITLSGQNKTLPAIFLLPDAKQLSMVVITGDAIPVQIKGDTIQYNADAFKVNPDASAEDLIKKMPGVTTDGNTVKVNGEEVKKVLVDGQPFFSDDPSATLKNLPADMVGSVQVFDQQDEQSEFTGFRNGNEEKTINLVTKKGMNVGSFGKVYAGYGTDEKYNAGFTYNRFNGSRRISLLGMSNNINQQNFSIPDIMSVMSNSGRQSMGPPGAGGGLDFFSGQQNGITHTNAFGLNYNDTWGKKIRVSGNYFFNHTDNRDTSSLFRSYYTGNNLQYRQTGSSQTRNLNHKFNLKLEYFIDTLNKITITPRLTLQQYSNSGVLTGKTSAENSNLSDLENRTFSNADGYNFSNDLLYQHRFRTKGRTISLNINTQVSNTVGDGGYYSSMQYYDSSLAGTITDQHYTTLSRSTTVGTNLSYTEPAGKKGQLLFYYKPSYTVNESDRKVQNADANGEYTQQDAALSNTYTNSYHVQRGGVTYKWKTATGLLSAGADVQQAVLKGNETFPDDANTAKTFFSVLPALSYSYSPGMYFNMNVSYRANTKSPSVSQLQNSIDQSNSLFIRSGNPDLEQVYENTFTLRAMKRLPEKEKHFILFIRATQTNNYIGSSTVIASLDTVIQNISVKQGSQFTMPVNLNNYYNINSFFAFGFPVKKIKSNLNFNAGYTLTNTPALINNQVNYSLNNGLRAGFYLASNVSPNLDFSLSYNGSYNTVSNSLQTQSNSSYLSHTFIVKANYILRNRIVFNTDLNQYYYTGLSSDYNQSFSLWNASVGYKLLKDRSLEMKLSAYDLLNQNTSISRTITETYTEESETQVLNRYFLLTLTYTFKKFKNGAVGPEEMTIPKDLPPPGSMPPPPGR